MTLFNGWFIKKANADAERNHLNKILVEVRDEITGLDEQVTVLEADVAALEASSVQSVGEGVGIDVDTTDVNNPIVALDAATQTSLALADTALQPGALDHNTLDGLQGGTTDEYYHLTLAEHETAQTLLTALQLVDYPAEILPSAAPAGRLIFVSDETGGPVPAFSDGTNWRRVTDRAIVSI